MNPLPRPERKALIEAMEKAHAGFMHAIEGLTPREAAQKGATPLWSLKDLLAHMVGWHHEALKRVAELVQGAKGKPNAYGPEEIQAMNRKFVDHFKGMPWGLLLKDLRNLHSGLVEMAKEVPERFLDPKSGVCKWLNQVGCRHYHEHIEAVEKQAAQLKSQRRTQGVKP
jgi:hypothetical protein